MRAEKVMILTKFQCSNWNSFLRKKVLKDSFNKYSQQFSRKCFAPSASSSSNTNVLSIYVMPKEKTGSRSPSNNKLCTIFIFGFLEYFFTGLCVGFISFVNILLRGLLLFYPHLAHSPSMIWVFFSFEKRANKMCILEFIQ